MAETTKKPFTLQLLRNADFSIGKDDALAKLKQNLASKKETPGQPILAFYSEPSSNIVHVLLGFSGTDNEDIFESSVEIDKKLVTLKNQILGTAGEGFETLGEIQEKIDTINGSDTAQGSFAKAIKDAIEKLDVESVGGDLKNFIYDIEEIDGKISPSVGQFASSDTTIKIENDDTNKILDFKVNIDNSTIVKNEDGVLSVASTALAQYDGSEAIEVGAVNEEKNTKTIALKLDGANSILSQSDKGLLATLKLELVEVDADGDNPAHKEIQLKDGNGHILGGVDATDFIADGMIEKVEVVEKEIDGKQVEFLRITWNATAGNKVVEINLGKYIDIYTEGNGINIEDNVVSVKVASDDKYIEVTENGIASKGIEDAISTAIENLNKDDSALDGQYVSAVSETNGKINISREKISNAKLTELSEKENFDETDIVENDLIKDAFAKLQKRIAELEAYNNSFVTIDCGEYDTKEETSPENNE